MIGNLCRVLCLCSFASLWLAGASAAEPRTGGTGARSADDHLRVLLDKGWSKGSAALRTAEAEWRAAGAADPGDPWVDYAYGLVLAYQARHKPALETFAAAVDKAGDTAWQIRQALIWSQFVNKQYDESLDGLEHLAELVRQHSEVSAEERQAAARWIGRALEALQVCAEPKAFQDKLPERYVAIGSLLEDDLRDALDEGRQAVRDEYDDLLALSDAVKADAAKADAAAQREKSKQIASNLEDTTEQREAAQQSVAQLKAALDEVIAETDKQLGKLQKDYQFLETRAESLSQSITALGREMTVFEMNRANVGQRNNQQPRNAQRQQLLSEQQQQAYQLQMLNYQTEYNATAQRAAEVVQRGQLVLQQRAAAVKQYEAATGQIVKKNADLDKFEERLKKQSKKLTTQPVGRSTKATLTARKATWLRSYVELDLDAEKARLLIELTAAE